MKNGWTPERRKKQSKNIQKWKPWEKSTGPHTEQGRTTSSMNALKHGMRSAEIRSLESAMAKLARIERDARRVVG